MGILRRSDQILAATLVVKKMLRERDGSVAKWLNGVRIDPLSVLPDQINYSFVSLFLRDVIAHTGFSNVEIDFSGSSADVAEVCIGHFTRAVYDAAHDGDLHALEVSGLAANTLGGRLQVEQGPTTGRAGHKLRLGDASASALEDVVGEFHGAMCIGLGLEAYQIAQSITQ